MELFGKRYKSYIKCVKYVCAAAVSIIKKIAEDSFGLKKWRLIAGEIKFSFDLRLKIIFIKIKCFVM